MERYREGVDWTELVHDIIHNKRLVNTASNFHVTQKTRNYQSRWITVSFSRGIEVGIFALGSERVRNHPIESTRNNC
jgi:hypothetical protein